MGRGWLGKGKLLAAGTCAALGASAGWAVFPGATWQTRTPAQVGLAVEHLADIQDYLGGRGAIVRHGYLVYTWGNYQGRTEIASASKPFYSHFLQEAVEQGRLASVDLKAASYTPCLQNLNPDLGFKDRGITFRQMANQISGYGVSESPAAAFDYNDWQMALFWDTLFLKVWNTTYAQVDAAVLDAHLGSALQFQDDPTFMYFGTQTWQGMVGISPRDHCRFGLLYLNRGSWNGVQIISEEHALTSTSRPLFAELPRTSAVEADMCPGQRTIGSGDIPDDQTDHYGSYSWLWWVNGFDDSGSRYWPDAESNVFAALGHAGGMRGMAVVPCLDLVIAWNDTALGSYPSHPHPLNEVFRLLYLAADTSPGAPPEDVGPVLEGRLQNGPQMGQATVHLDWSADLGWPRPGGHYHVLRGTSPFALDLAEDHPIATTSWSEAVSDPPAPAEPPVVFYQVVAASACEQVSTY